MRIKISFTPNTQPILVGTEIDILNSYIHRCLGKDNKYHNSFSPYSISSLQGCKLHDGILSFDNGAYIILSFPNGEMQFFNDIYKNIPITEIGYGMKFKSLEVLPNNVGKKFDWVQTISPILLIEKGTNRRLTFKDNSFIDELNERTRKKLLHYDADINLKNFKIEICETYGRNKTKLVKSHNGKVKNISNMMRLKVSGHPDTRKILYEMGLGNSCGSGFGSVISLTNDWFSNR